MFDERDFGTLFKIFSFAFKAFVWTVKAAYFCGLLWLVVPFALGIAYEEITGTIIKGGTLQEKVFMLLFYIACVLAVLTFIQNVIRMIKKDRSFSLLKAILGREPKKGFEAKLDGKTVALMNAGAVSGFVLGKHKDKYVTIPEKFDFHALVIGGPGSGKSACCAIPTLMSWGKNDGSQVFAIDIKGELFQKCKKARGEAQIKVFNPTDPDNSYGYDPFWALKHTKDVPEEARALALSICPLPPDTKDPFWIRSAQSLLTGCLLYFFHKDLSFSETMRMIKSKPIQNTVAEIMLSGDEQAIYEISQFAEADPRTLGGIFGELANHINIFATSADLQRALSGEGRQITPEDLENGYDIFCCIPEHKLDIWKDLMAMMIDQFLRSFERRPEQNIKPVLFLVDEFARMGKVEHITSSLATLRSKKIRICLIIQSKSQLSAIYGNPITETIADNCNVKLILRCSEPNTADWVSKMVGTYDKHKKSSSYNANVIGIGKGMGTSSTTEEKRIIKPEAFAFLDEDLVCILPNGYRKLRKVYWFKDKYFSKKI